jgi:hypothetical protein
MSEKQEVPKIATFGVIGALILGGVFIYHDWKTTAAAKAVLTAQTPEDLKKNEIIAKLAASLRTKAAAKTTSLTDDELILNKCVTKTKADEQAARTCFWVDKESHAVAEAARLKKDALDRAAIIAAAEREALIMKARRDEPENEQMETSGAQVPASGVLAARAPKLTDPETHKDVGRPADITPPRSTATTSLVPTYAPKPSGPVIPGRTSRTGGWIPTRQLQN